MPFWRGDGVGRPLEFGRAIGQLTRELSRSERAPAVERLMNEHALEQSAAEILFDYVAEQLDATGEVPSDRSIVIESFLDEIGDWRVVVLSPFGARVHAPWAMTVAARLRERYTDVDVVWCDDGIVLRIPESDTPPDADRFIPDPEDTEDDVVRALADTSLFAARFRENAARALLLPRRFPGQRTPLWLQRRKSADLLDAASRHPGFPILLETYRECLRDAFDLPGLNDVLAQIRDRRIRVHAVVTDRPSPFAQSVLFDFTATFLYDADAPLAERRAQVLSLDHAQLKELLGSADYRDLLDADAMAAIVRRRALLDPPRMKDADDVHDLLLALGDLDRAEIEARVVPDLRSNADVWIGALVDARRAIEVRVAGDARLIAVEDAARYRDALGTVLPQGLPAALLEPSTEPLRDLVSRYARTHGPFVAQDPAARFGVGVDVIRRVLGELAVNGRVLEGGFTQGGRTREWIDHDVLKQIKRRSLAGWREQIEAVEPYRFAAFLTAWQGVRTPRRGDDALVDTIEQLQGAPLPASVLETEILPARIDGYRIGQIDELFVSGELVWRGLEPVGGSDGRIALYFTDQYPLLAPPPESPPNTLAARIFAILNAERAPFFDDIVDGTGAFPNDVLEALWDLVWTGNVTNDSIAPLRARLGISTRPGRTARTGQRRGTRHQRQRPQRLPGSEGRWALFDRARWAETPSPTECRAAQVQQLVDRYGIVVKEVLGKEGIAGGFARIYPVLKAMEEAGRLRRGYFVDGLGASQFAVPGADDRLRSVDEDGAPLVLSATDPANAYGTALAWPAVDGTRLARVAGARVILSGGRLLGYLARSAEQLTTFLPPNEPERGHATAALVEGLKLAARGRRHLLVSAIDGETRAPQPLHQALVAAGFQHGYRGYGIHGAQVVELRA